MAYLKDKLSCGNQCYLINSVLKKTDKDVGYIVTYQDGGCNFLITPILGP